MGQEGYSQQRVGLQEADCALKPPSDSIRTEQIPYALQKRVILYRLELDSSNELFLCPGGGGAARVLSLFRFFCLACCRPLPVQSVSFATCQSSPKFFEGPRCCHCYQWAGSEQLSHS